jgi:hypothetical protein
VAEDMGCRRMLWPIPFALSQAVRDDEERQRLLGQAQATIGYIVERISDSSCGQRFSTRHLFRRFFTCRPAHDRRSRCGRAVVQIRAQFAEKLCSYHY